MLEGAILKRANLEGVLLSTLNIRKADLSKANLKNADFSGADLTSSTLDGADLENADLADSVFESASMVGASLKNAKVECANFTNVDLSESDLFSASFAERLISVRTNYKSEGTYTVESTKPFVRGANLSNATLTRANLENANLEGAQLDDAYLERANLDGANFKIDRHSRFYLDANSILGTKFTPGSRDCWNTLRRCYTGQWFLIFLCLTAAVVFPQLFSAIQWSIQFIPNGDVPPPGMKETQMWKAVTRWEQGYPSFSKEFAVFVLTISLIIYNLLRFWLTIKVQNLREEEERSQSTPSARDYRTWWRIHRYIVTPVGFLCILAFIVKARLFLLQPAWMPS